MTTESWTRSHRDRVGRSDRGSAALETAALLPLIILFGVMVLECGVAMWTMVETDTAVRSAARAAGSDSDPSAAKRAAEKSLPAVLTAALGSPTVTPLPDVKGVRVTLEVKIPGLSILGPLTVTRHADMPNTP